MSQSQGSPFTSATIRFQIRCCSIPSSHIRSPVPLCRTTARAGEGTSFTVTLPFQLATAADSAAGTSPSWSPTTSAQQQHPGVLPPAAAASAPQKPPSGSEQQHAAPHGIRVAVCVRNGSLAAAMARALGAEGFQVGVLPPPPEEAATDARRPGTGGGGGGGRNAPQGSSPAARPLLQVLKRRGSFVTPNPSLFASLAVPAASPPPSPAAPVSKEDDLCGPAAGAAGRALTPVKGGASASVVVHASAAVSRPPPAPVPASGTSAAEGDEAAADVSSTASPTQQAQSRSPITTAAAAERGWLAAAAEAACPGDGPCVLVIDCVLLSTSLGTTQVSFGPCPVLRHLA